jgi:hypothetical protein
MSRDDGFDVADVNTGHLDDPKVRSLWRALGPDQDAMSRALLLHFATILASWRQGCRVPVDEAVPVWLDPDAALVDALRAAGLLDRSGKLPARSWKGWFSPAWERREVRRESGRLGGLRAKGQRPVSDAIAMLQAPDSGATPDRPTGRSVRTVRQDRPSVAGEAPKNGARATTTRTLAELVTPEALAAVGRKP